jgi:hypothetical protein
MLNIWIPLEDVEVWPLAFVKGSSVKGYDEGDEEREFVYVKNMKKGEMLVYYGSHLVHGSPFTGEGSRSALSVYFDFRKRDSSDEAEEMYWKNRSGYFF